MVRGKQVVLIGLIPIVLIAIVLSQKVRASESLGVGLFSGIESIGENVLPMGWEPMVFNKIKRRTDYHLVRDDGIVVVKAESDDSSSGLRRKIRIDIQEYPILRWRWKVKNILEKGDATRKSGDDYPGRIYVLFEIDAKKLGFIERAKYESARLIYGEYPPLAALVYIWANKTKIGSVLDNPFIDKAKMCVVESGDSKLGTWVIEERNVLEDFLAAFGEQPPPISGVAIMTDSDNTGESAVAFYGDIAFRKQ